MPPSRRLAAIITVALVGMVVLVVTTGTSLLPPALLLGPCLPDWTSPNSYGPRASPLATVRFSAGAVAGELCYGRPARRGRAIYGALVPFDTLWRLGANEPTRLYLKGAVSLAGIPLAAGRYSLYVRPGRDRWTLFVSRSVLHWGNDISAAVRAREVGHAPLTPQALVAPVETLSVSAESSGDTAWLSFDWDSTRVSVPVIGTR